MLAITEMTNWAVDLIDVRKTYRPNVQALRGVNVQVGRGEIFGLLGPNGAGKSTLVRIMTTVVRPTSAYGTLLGRPLGHREKIGRIGYLPETLRLPRYLTGSQALDYLAALAKVPRSIRRKRAADLLDRVGLTKDAGRRVDQYSKGMLQRLGIAQSLMNDPELVILDEPTDGLDPVGRRDVRELLLELRRAGKTIFLNSHLLSELERVCDRVAILVDGMIARQGTLSQLTERETEYRIVVEGTVDAARANVQALGATIDGREIKLRGHDLRRLNEVLDALRAARVLIQSVETSRFSLEDILIQVVGESTPTARPAGTARPVSTTRSVPTERSVPPERRLDS